MTRWSDDNDTEILFSAADAFPSTAAMPAVEVSELAPVKPASHRRPPTGFNLLLAAWVCAGCGLIFLVTAGLILMSRDGGASREQARPSTPPSSLPAVVIPAPTYTPRKVPSPTRRIVPAVPMPSAKRSSATPKPSVSATPKATHSTTPAPSVSPSTTPTATPPPVEPVAPCVATKETPCPTA